MFCQSTGHFFNIAYECIGELKIVKVILIHIHIKMHTTAHVPPIEGSMSFTDHLSVLPIYWPCKYLSTNFNHRPRSTDPLSILSSCSR